MDIDIDYKWLEKLNTSIYEKQINALFKQLFKTENMLIKEMLKNEVKDAN